MPAAPPVRVQKRASAPPVFRPDTVQAMAARRVGAPPVYHPNAPVAQLRPAPAWPLQAARPVPLTPAETMRRAMAGHTNPAGTVQRAAARLVERPAAAMPVAVVQPRLVSPRSGQPFQTETRTVDQLHDIFVRIVRNDYDAAHQIDQAIDNHETLEHQFRPTASLSSHGRPTAASTPAEERPTLIAAARAMIAEKSLNISADGSRSGAFASGVAGYVPLDTARRAAMGYSQLFRDRPHDSIDDFVDMIPDLSLIDMLNPAALRRKVETAIADTEVRVRTAVENARPVPIAINAAATTVKHGTNAAATGIRAAKKASEAAEACQRERDALFAQLDDLTRETRDYAELVAAQAAGGTAAGFAATRAAKAAVRWNMRRTGAASASGRGAGGPGTWGSSPTSGSRWTPPGSATASAWHAPAYPARGTSGVGRGGAEWVRLRSQLAAERARARAAAAIYQWATPRPFPTTVRQVAARAGGMAGKAAVIAGGLAIAAGFAARQQMAPRFDPINDKLRQLRKPEED
jgi:hypothetical protein